MSDNRSDERASNVTELKEGIASAADMRRPSLSAGQRCTGKMYQQGAQAADYVSRTTAE